eukprot:scaffold204733_cov17-Tisochrysis_lutea.AAC.1
MAGWSCATHHTAQYPWWWLINICTIEWRLDYLTRRVITHAPINTGLISMRGQESTIQIHFRLVATRSRTIECLDLEIPAPDMDNLIFP